MAYDTLSQTLNIHLESEYVSEYSPHEQHDEHEEEENEVGEEHTLDLLHGAETTEEAGKEEK